jgi:hypothetical protein
MSRSVWVVVGATISVVVVGMGLGVAVISGAFDGDDDTAGAEKAVREYLQLIADGKAEQANGVVPLLRTPVDGDDEFLTDDVLGAADERISVGEVSTKSSYADKATVAARYRLGDRDVQIDVRTERVGEAWRLLDTVATPVLIRSNMPTLDHATVGDVEVPASTKPVGLDPTDTILLYPGEYSISGIDTDYLSLHTDPVAVFDDRLYGHARPLEVAFDYQPEVSLTSSMSSSVTELVRDCVEDVAKPGTHNPECRQVFPSTTVARDGTFAVPEMPLVDKLDPRAITDYGWRFLSSWGVLRHIPTGGAATETNFQIKGVVSVTPDGDIRVDYDD